MHMSSFVVVVRAKNRENKLDWNDSWRLYLIYMEMKRLPVFLVMKNIRSTVMAQYAFNDQINCSDWEF